MAPRAFIIAGECKAAKPPPTKKCRKQTAHMTGINAGINADTFQLRDQYQHIDISIRTGANSHTNINTNNPITNSHTSTDQYGY